MRKEKKMDLLSRLVRQARGAANRDKMVLFVPVARPGTKGHPLLSRPGVSGWKAGTKRVSQLEQH